MSMSIRIVGMIKTKLVSTLREVMSGESRRPQSGWSTVLFISKVVQCEGFSREVFRHMTLVMSVSGINSIRKTKKTVQDRSEAGSGG